MSVGGSVVDEMIAERRFYPFPGSDTTEAAIRVRPLDILYVTLGEQAPTAHGPCACIITRSLPGFGPVA